MNYIRRYAARLTFLILILLLGLSAEGQSSSSFLAHFYSTNPLGKVAISECVRSPLGEFVLTGSYEDAIQIDNSVQSDTNHSHYLMKLDANGNHLWTITFGNKGYLFIENLDVGDDGSIFISGNFEDSISIQNHSIQSAGFQPFMWKIDPQGHFAFAFDFRSNPNVIVRPRFSAKNGEITISIVASDSLSYGTSTVFPGLSSKQIGFFARYDYNGNLLYSKVFDSPDFFFILDPDRLAANSMIVQVMVDDSDSLFFGSSYFTGNQLKGTWFFELDSTFSVVNSQFIEYEGLAGFEFKGLNSSGDFMYTGGYSGMVTDGNLTVQNLNFPNNTFGLMDGLFMVMDPNLVPILLKSTGVKDNNDRLTGAINLGEHYFLCGSAKGDLIYGVDTLFKTSSGEGFVLEIDKTGNKQGFIRTQNNNLIAQTEFSGIFRYDNMSFAVYGTTNVNAVFNNDTIDRQGLLDGFIWHYSDQKFELEEMITADNGIFSLFPNPSSEILHIHNSSENQGTWKLQIFDIRGSLIFSALPYLSPLDISQLQPGIYIFELSDVMQNQRVRKKILIK